MTKETARIIVEQLDNYLSHTCQDYGERDHEAMTIAIKALEQESQTFEWCKTCKEYDYDKHCCPRYTKVIRNTVEEMKQEQEPCDKCEVGNPCLYCKHEFEPQESEDT